MRNTDHTSLFAISILTALAIVFAGTAAGFLEGTQALEKSDKLSVAASHAERLFADDRYWSGQ